MNRKQAAWLHAVEVDPPRHYAIPTPLGQERRTAGGVTHTRIAIVCGVCGRPCWYDTSGLRNRVRHGREPGWDAVD